MKRSSFFLFVVSVAAAVTMFACGNGDDTTTSTAGVDGSAPAGDAAAPSDATTGVDSSVAVGVDAAIAVDGSSADGSAATVLSFAANVYEPIIATRCLFCHGPGAADGGPGIGIQYGKLDMTTEGLAYTNLVGDGGGAFASGVACSSLGATGLRRVAAGDPIDSLLYNKVASNDGDGGTTTLADGGTAVFCGQTMPEHEAALPAADLAAIHDWIAQGANP